MSEERLQVNLVSLDKYFQSAIEEMRETARAVCAAASILRDQIDDLREELEGRRAQQNGDGE